VNWLGDAIMSIPALVRLREAKPDAQIALLTSEKLADLWLHHPSINEVIPFASADGVGAVSTRLREKKFKTALIFPNSFRSALEPWLAGIPDRLGYPGNGRTLLLTRKIAHRAEEMRMRKRSVSEVKRLVSQNPEKHRDTYPPSAHHIFDYLRLVEALGANDSPIEPRIHITPAEIEEFRRKWQLPYSKELIIGLNPGAEYGPAKRWPIERFVETMREVHGHARARYIIFGGKNDFPLAKQLESIRSTSYEILNVAGKTSLRELCVGLSLCDLLLTNDTGPMHVAAAVGTRVVVPFGSTSPELTGPGFPGQSEHQLILGAAPCAPCFLRECPIDFRCMKSIAVEQVVNAIRRVINRPA